MMFRSIVKRFLARKLRQRDKAMFATILDKEPIELLLDELNFAWTQKVDETLGKRDLP